MPILVKDKHLQNLKEAIEGMTGTDAEIADVLNVPTQEGVEYAELESRPVIDALGTEVYAALEAAAADGSSASAALLLGYLAYPGTLAVGAGTGGRATVDALVDEGFIPASTRDALVAAAEFPAMTGPSLGQTLGIGLISPEFVEQARIYPELVEQHSAWIARQEAKV